MNMNNENTLSFISSMISADSSYKALMDIIEDMDLEVMTIQL